MNTKPFFTILLLVLLSQSVLGAQIGRSLCENNSSTYACYKVKRQDRWETLFKNPSERKLVMRINRMNIPLRQGETIAIPRSTWFKDIMDYSPFLKKIAPHISNKKVIHVSIHPGVLAWGAYDKNGYLTAWGPAVGGAGWCPDLKRACNTALGTFFIYRKGNARCVSQKFPIPHGGAPMPYCMYFYHGFAIHGSYSVPGANASHGCIRTLVEDAEWLNNVFVGNEDSVVVKTTKSAKIE